MSGRDSQPTVFSSNQYLYALKRRPRVATHITQELIEAHILDGAPLPEGLRIGGCTFHKVNRWVRSVSMFCKAKSTSGLPVAIGEWLLGPDEHGNCDTVQNWVFERDWEPYSAVETPAPQKCEWGFDAGDDAWQTGCGQMWVLTCNDLHANGLKFCPCCGREVDDLSRPAPKTSAEGT